MRSDDQRVRFREHLIVEEMKGSMIPKGKAVGEEMKPPP